jgi:hypothetical protein
MKASDEAPFGLDARYVELEGRLRVHFFGGLRCQRQPSFRQSCGVKDIQRLRATHISCEFSLLRQSRVFAPLGGWVSCTDSRRRSWLQLGDVARPAGA